MKDGPMFSPDAGRCWRKNNVLYWEDGDITAGECSRFIRLMPMPDGEDYSLWTDEKRTSVKAEWA
jgi:hypothetical protein